MAESPDKDIFSLLKNSGFPFQMGVRRQIERTQIEHGWLIDAEEYRWQHPLSNETGFVDLVASHSGFLVSLVIECKRNRDDGKWLFLIPRGHEREQARVSTLCTMKTKTSAGTPEFLGWSDFDFTPGSPEAAYCLIHSQDEKNPMLERITDSLLPSVESVGHKDVALKSEVDYLCDYRLFVPLIVTNATLYAAEFDPEEVDMTTGRLPEGKCTFKEVPLIRFRKSLTSHYPRADRLPRDRGPLSLRVLENERTVLVANSASLTESLKSLRLADTGEGFGGKLFDLFRRIR